MARFRLSLFFYIIALLFTPVTIAGDDPVNPVRAFQLAEATPDNQLPLLGDRFRIDADVDSVDMVFFRDHGTKPVVLILPDGSKWYHNRHPAQVTWASGPDYDQVRISQPMRGPWQVSGDLRPESRVMITSDIQFHADPMPDVVFTGERLRITGRFTEAGQPIEQRDFRNVISTRLFLVSTNTPDHANFGISPVELGEFLDDGLGLDKQARDGVFTGEVAFDVLPGEYIPSYRAETPLFRRTFEQQPFLVKPVPVSIRVDVAKREDEPHILQLTLDESDIQANDVIIRGDIEYPNGEIQRVDISTRLGDTLRQRIPNYAYGIFQLNLKVHGTSPDGREFSARLARYEFTARRPEPAPPSAEELAQQRSAERRAIQQQQLAEEKAQMRQRRLLLLFIIGFNVLVVSLWILLLWWRNKRAK